MIVRSTPDAWQVVLQTDHAALAGELAAAWGNARFEAPRPRRAVVAAAARHDDGWAIWERAPSLLSTNGTQMPRNFLDVQVVSHLAFYRAQIVALLDDDRYAGLLVAMHGCGIYKGRYGTDPALKLTFAPLEQRAVDAFVREHEQRQQELVAELHIDESELWTNYRLLQVFDRLSLYFCTNDVERGTPWTLAPVPVGYGGEETGIQIEPDAPWRVRMDPFPFKGREASFTLPRRVLPKRAWEDVDEFRRAFFATEPAATPVVISAD